MELGHQSPLPTNAKSVAHYGTFDVDNYGDLLFPHIIEWRLKGVHITHVSPTARRPLFEDARQCTDQTPENVSCVLVGGGNIVHLRPTSVESYKDVSKLAYPGLSAGAAEFAARSGAALAVNAPSIAVHRLNLLERYVLSRVFSSAAYLSFRDVESVKTARQLGAKDVELVPDTAFDIARMWPIAAMGHEPSEPYMVVHVNSRYGGDARDIAKALDDLSAREGFLIKLLAIGPCHNDIEYMRSVSSLMKSEHKCISDYRLRRFAVEIARSSIYIGSSMHGFITAASYGVPGVLVLGTSVKAKFFGVLDACGMPESLIFSKWVDLLSTDLPQITMTDEVRSRLFARLDAHWHKVEEVIKAPVQRQVPEIVLQWEWWVRCSQSLAFLRRRALRLGRAIIAR